MKHLSAYEQYLKIRKEKKKNKDRNNNVFTGLGKPAQLENVTGYHLI